MKSKFRSNRWESVVATIAGSDSSAGAGIQADIKTFAALGVYGATILTALTAQNTRGVQSVFHLPSEFISRQCQSVFDDLDVRVIKVGMIGTAEAIVTIGDQLDKLEDLPVVVDPVMIATSGAILLEAKAEKVLLELLIPRADILTPNLQEAARLLGCGVAMSLDEMEKQSDRLLDIGARSVLIKGGHSDHADATDVYNTGQEKFRFSAPRVLTKKWTA